MSAADRASFDALDAAEPYDACIIGSGPAGTVVAKALVEKGLRTLLLESGSSLLRWLGDRKTKSLADIDFTGDTDYPLTMTKGRLLGGNSNFWTGRCERFHPSDFGAHPYAIAGSPWPIGYGDLEPYYERAETLLRVRGGERSAYAPPRRDAFPLPARPDITPLKEIASEAGVILDDSPTATPTRALRFYKVQKEILPAFARSPKLTLVTGATVTRLVADAEGRIVGAETAARDGTRKVARARSYVVACGGIESPRLLLLSRSERFPNGIGNAHDRVGRGFNEHPSVNFYARIPHRWGTIVPTNKIGRAHHFYDHFRTKGLGSVLPVFRQSWVLPHHNMPFKLSNVPRNVASIAGRIAAATLYIGVVVEMRVSDSNRVALSSRMKDAFGQPLAHLIFSYGEDDRALLDGCRELVRGFYARVGASGIREDQVTWSRHHQGACRMGASPATSVVDPQLRVHESPNLYVCGSEVFVTGGAMQPCLSIVALACRLGDHLVDRFARGEGLGVARQPSAGREGRTA